MEERVKSVFSKIGIGGLVAGGLVLNVIHIVVVWGTGLATIGAGLDLLFHNSVILGLLVIFIGTPLMVAISEFLFPFYLILLIIILLVGLIRWLFGI